MKRTVFVLLILFITTFVFAQTGSESVKQEYNIIYIPRSVANNSNVMIDLSLSQTITNSNIPTEASFSNDSTGHLSIFRLRDSLENVAYNNGLQLTISSSNDWNFVNEKNSTVKRPFRVTSVRFVGNRSSNGTYNYEETGNVTVMNESGGNYILTLPLADTESGNPKNIYDIDICIEFISDGNDYSTIEPGYYSTELTVTTTGGEGKNGSFQIKKDGSASIRNALNEKIKVRGYIGADPGTNFATYSFIVSDSTDTYNMDLGISEHGSDGAKVAYKVAHVSFLYSEVTTEKLSGSSNTTDRFTISISPNPDNNSGGQYQFILQNTDHQPRTNNNTVYYDLYIRTGSEDLAAGFTAMSSTSGSSSVASGTVGSWGYKTLGQPVYLLKPKFADRQIMEAGSATYLLFFDVPVGTDLYENTWTLEQDIWLEISSSSLETYKQHIDGLYWSYLYFTLIVND